MFQELPTDIKNLIIKQLISDDFPGAKRIYDAWVKMSG